MKIIYVQDCDCQGKPIGPSIETSRIPEKTLDSLRHVMKLEYIPVLCLECGTPFRREESSSDMSEVRSFCKALIKQYERLVMTERDNFGSALCVVQKWEIDKLREILG